MRNKPSVRLLVTLAFLACAAGVIHAQPVSEEGKIEKRLLITNDGVYESEADVSSWVQGESFVHLSGYWTGYPYPWQGEDTIDYRARGGLLWVNGKLVGADLTRIDIDEIADPGSIITVKVDRRRLPDLPKLPNLMCVNGSYDYSYGSSMRDEDLSYLTGIKNLRVLSLAHQSIGDSGLKVLGSLTGLRLLDLAHTNTRDEDLRYLCGLMNLLSLNLGWTDVSGDSLFYLASLARLKQLNLSDYYPTVVYGQNLSALTALDSLQELRLCYTRVTDTGFAVLGKISSLKRLDLSDAEIDGWDMRGISGLTGLEELDLSGIWIGDEAALPLAGLIDLKKLDLSYTQVTSQGLAALSGLGNLKELYLRGTNVEGSACLKGFTELRKLSINTVPATKEGLKDLEGLKKIEDLEVSEVERDTALVWVAGLPNLKRFVAPSGMMEQGLRYLEGLFQTVGRLPSKLEELDLGGCHAGDEGLSHIAALGNLRVLTPPYGTTDEGLRYIRGLSELRKLNLVTTEVTDRGLANLEGLVKLRYLNLRLTKIKGSGFAYLEGLTNLEELDLSETSFGNTGLKQLGMLTSLLKLDIENHRITDAGLAYLGRLSKLEELSLEGMRLTDAGVGRLIELLPDCRIDYTPKERDVMPLPKRYKPLILRTQAGRWEIDASGLSEGKDFFELEYFLYPYGGEREIKYKLKEGLLKVEGKPAAGIDLRKTGLDRIENAEGFITAIADAEHVEALKSLPNLVAVKLVEDSLPLDLGSLEGLHNLRCLYINAPALGEDGLAPLESLSNLSRLELYIPGVTDAELAHLTKMHRLRHLELGFTWITGEGFMHLRGLKKLRSLSLNSNAMLGDEGIRMLSKLKGLSELDIYGSPLITEASIPYFRSMRRLKRLDLWGNGLDESVWLRLKARLPGCDIEHFQL